MRRHPGDASFNVVGRAVPPRPAGEVLVAVRHDAGSVRVDVEDDDRSVGGPEASVSDWL